jgi:hypothetical protein
MTSSSLLLGTSGIILIFAPDLLLNSIGISTNPTTSILLVKIVGGLYFGYSTLNWMVKESRIGGIYNRPIAVANFTHFLIAGLSLTKALISDLSLPFAIWIAAIVYIIMGSIFLVVLLKHPDSIDADQ